MSTFKRVTTVLGFAVFALLLAGSVLAMLQGVRVVPVLTGSMAPEYKAGSVAITRPVDAAAIETGDVVAFAPPSPFSTPQHRPVLHRVVGVQHGSQGVGMRTKGDANTAPDPWLVSLEGTHLYESVGSVPFVGRIVAALTTAQMSSRITAVVGLGLIAIAIVFWPRSKTRCQCNGFNVTT